MDRKRAEDFFPTKNKFRLITIGKAFHWMDQEFLAPHLYSALEKDGGLALTFGRSWWSGMEEWQKAVIGVIKDFLGDQRRAGAGTFKPSEKTIGNILMKAHLKVESRKFVDNYKMNIQQIIGFAYSTSFASRRLFGSRIDEFEKKLKDVLLGINPQGEFISSDPTWVILAWPN